MLAEHIRLRPNTEDVAAKVIDGEAIIMNLSNGLYFSMDQVGSAVWEMVEEGRSIAEISDGLAARFDVARERLEEDVHALLKQLMDENLVLEDAGGAAAPAAPWDGPRMAYVSPVLNKYDDMADLLALDPPMPGLGNLPAE